MAELTTEQRLENLEKFAPVKCRKCRGEFTLSSLEMIEWPKDADIKLPLCYNCVNEYWRFQRIRESGYKSDLADWFRNKE